MGKQSSALKVLKILIVVGIVLTVIGSVIFIPVKLAVSSADGSGNAPSLFGSKFLLMGKQVPAVDIPDGSMVTIKDIDAGSLQPGNIIVFKTPAGYSGNQVYKRLSIGAVYDVDTKDNTTIFYVLKKDLKDGDDPKEAVFEVSSSLLLGEGSSRIDGIFPALIGFVDSPFGLLLLITLPAGILIISLVLFLILRRRENYEDDYDDDYEEEDEDEDDEDMLKPSSAVFGKKSLPPEQRLPEPDYSAYLEDKPPKVQRMSPPTPSGQQDMSLQFSAEPQTAAQPPVAEPKQKNPVQLRFSSPPPTVQQQTVSSLSTAETLNSLNVENQSNGLLNEKDKELRKEENNMPEEMEFDLSKLQQQILQSDQFDPTLDQQMTPPSAPVSPVQTPPPVQPAPAPSPFAPAAPAMGIGMPAASVPTTGNMPGMKDPNSGLMGSLSAPQPQQAPATPASAFEDSVIFMLKNDSIDVNFNQIKSQSIQIINHPDGSGFLIKTPKYQADITIDLKSK